MLFLFTIFMNTIILTETVCYVRKINIFTEGHGGEVIHIYSHMFFNLYYRGLPLCTVMYIHNRLVRVLFSTVLGAYFFGNKLN